MKIKYSLIGFIIEFLFVTLNVKGDVNATYIQRNNALLQYSRKSLHMINNHNVQFVKVEYPYTWASTPSGFNKIKSIKGSPCTFKTKYLLPNTHAISNNVNYNTSNPQSMAYVGKYLFIVYSPHNDGKGFIIRYNTNKFNKKSFKETQQLSLKKNISGIKIGPQITIGHGQSLAYNKKNHTLWMWKDRSDMKPTKKLFEISKSGVGKLRQTLKLPSLYWCAAVVHSFSRADDIFPTS